MKILNKEIAYLVNIKTHLLDEVIDLRQEKCITNLIIHAGFFMIFMRPRSLDKDKIMECRSAKEHADEIKRQLFVLLIGGRVIVDLNGINDKS
ncbi:MAG: hypothetical protein ACLUUO_05655 [Sellimonas intestinalis]